MKYLFLIFPFLMFSQIGFSQSKQLKNAKCSKINNLSEIQRLSNFPFSEASKIKIISFKGKMVGGIGDELQEHIN